MPALPSVLEALDELTIARRITIPIDNVRVRYRLASNTVRDVREFERIIGDFLRVLYSECVAPGARLPDHEATSRAKRHIESTLRRKRQTLENAIANGIEGLSGGMAGVLDAITEAVKMESIEHYMEDVFDRYVALNSWSERVAVVRELMARYHNMLPESIRNQPAEKFAADYKALLREMIEIMREMATHFRRI